MPICTLLSEQQMRQAHEHTDLNIENFPFQSVGSLGIEKNGYLVDKNVL